ncbi:hypothetical protein ASE87_15470 [Frigoribacterium sp. Leaf44]|nr:hypothetical protein ASE87_15470 [Frigoribacterium sp. Leaf44]
MLSSAVPIDPPTCWLVLTMAEATPAWPRSTPSVAVWIDAGMIEPMPKPSTIKAGSTLAAYRLSRSSRVSSSMPITPRVMPNGTMILGPKRGTKMFVDNWAASTSIAIIGRKARPVFVGV